MITVEREARQTSNLIKLFTILLSPLILCFNFSASAETAQENSVEKYNITIIYSAENKQQNRIAEALSKTLQNTYEDIVISKISTGKDPISFTKQPDLSIFIGSSAIQHKDNISYKAKRLFIATDPVTFKGSHYKNKSNAVIYMTQSYCKQVSFIKSLNDKWKTVSVLSSQEKPIDSDLLLQCASKHDLNIHQVNITNTGKLRSYIKDALTHSDVLLALPDKNIYNRKTVKNILLTSYRHRKPVIAFSKTFTISGALASIHSNAEQIALSANILVKNYFKNGQEFIHSASHPDAFDISINKQVFRALEIPIPDINELELRIEDMESENSGNNQ